MSGKKRSFHESGAVLMLPMRALNAANFTTFCGVSVKWSCGSASISREVFGRSALVSGHPQIDLRGAAPVAIDEGGRFGERRHERRVGRGFCSRNLDVVHTRTNVCGPPQTSYELSTVCTPPRLSSSYWKAATRNAR